MKKVIKKLYYWAMTYVGVIKRNCVAKKIYKK